ncbi:hypothetical protein MMC20_000038 [Loxospora ochrophaea]|nr:hypothetical protein [Loxospora ochrophaea]
MDENGLYEFNFSPMSRRAPVPMTEHAEPREWQSDFLGEEDGADISGDVGKGVADASDDEVLKGRGMLDEGGAVEARSEISFGD